MQLQVVSGLCKCSLSHWQWSREPPSPQSLWKAHAVHPWLQQEASCKPFLLHFPQHLPSDKRAVRGIWQTAFPIHVYTATDVQRATHVFFFQVKEVVDGFIHKLRATCDSHKVWVCSSTLGKPEINLKKNPKTSMTGYFLNH